MAESEEILTTTTTTSNTSEESSEEVSQEWKDFVIRSRQKKKYIVLAAPYMEDFAKRIVASNPSRFLYFETKWSKFPDGTDNICIGGFENDMNYIARMNILFISSFHNNDVTLSQFSVYIALLQSFIKSLTIVLPYFPVGTMERVVKEGQVATANTYSQLLSSLPLCGDNCTRLMVYDLHSLQNRFYLHGGVIASMQTAIPLLLTKIMYINLNIHFFQAYEKKEETSKRPCLDHLIKCIVFPDDGAAKRFKPLFTKEIIYESFDAALEQFKSTHSDFYNNNKELVDNERKTLDYNTYFDYVTCGKIRDGDERKIVIQEGNPLDHCCLILDDLVQSGGTLYECGNALRKLGAHSVLASVTHAVFPKTAWKRFTKIDPEEKAVEEEIYKEVGKFAVFDRFFVTDSIPTITKSLPKDNIFEILPLHNKVVQDLDKYT